GQLSVVSCRVLAPRRFNGAAVLGANAARRHFAVGETGMIRHRNATGNGEPTTDKTLKEFQVIRKFSTHGSRQNSGLDRGGFTLVELLIVIIVLAILVGLLLPVIAGALRTARNAAVQSEINNLAQALASFKSTFGDYPPSRILLCENGNYAS